MKNSQKGFLIPLLIIIVALSIGGGAYYYYSQKKPEISKVSQKPESQQASTTDTTQSVTSTRTISSSTVPSLIGVTFPNTYQGLGFTLKYPSDNVRVRTDTYPKYLLDYVNKVGQFNYEKVIRVFPNNVGDKKVVIRELSSKYGQLTLEAYLDLGYKPEFGTNAMVIIVIDNTKGQDNATYPTQTSRTDYLPLESLATQIINTYKVLPIDPITHGETSAVASSGERPLALNILLTDGKASYSNGVVSLEESLNAAKDTASKNTALIHLNFIKEQNDDSIAFEYNFPKPGDGDQLGIWIDDQQYFLVTGVLSSSNLGESNIDLSALGNGSHIMSIGLYAYGDVNASAKVSDLRIVKIKQVTPINQSQHIPVTPNTAQSTYFTIRDILLNLRATAELVYNQNNNSYNSLCSDGTLNVNSIDLVKNSVNKIFSLENVSSQKNALIQCYATKEAYVISMSKISGLNSYCIDHTGFAGIAEANQQTMSCK